MSLSPAFLDELRARTSLSGLIARTMKLTKAGNEFKGCCPFHNEKTPSFYVNDDKAFFHCFGCSAHGDAIRWLQEHGGLPFMDAVKELAAAAGLEMPARDPRDQAEADRRVPLFEAMERAQSFYAGNRDVRAATDFMAQRGISEKVAAEFGIGFAPDGGGHMIQVLRSAGLETAIAAGLVVSVEGKEPYDRFRARITFPIHDGRGRAIAFGARAIGDGQPKYLNSPETALFDKGRTLFNLHRAAPVARRSGRIIIVEGYMDVIGLAGVRIDDVVAPNGTAVTEHQLALAWRLSEAPILCMDGDAAGTAAMVKAATRALPALAPGKTLRFAALPNGQDPDDLARRGGAAAVETVLGASVGLAELLWGHEAAQGRLDEPEGRAGLRQRLSEHCQAIVDPNVRDQYRAEFKTRFDAAFAAPDRGAAPRRGARPWKRGRWKPEQAVAGETKALAGTGVADQVRLAILAGCLRFPDVVKAQYEDLAGLRVDGRYRELLDVLIDAAIAGELSDVGHLLESHGMAAAPAALARATRLPFSFLSETGDEARQSLVDAIYAEARQ